MIHFGLAPQIIIQLRMVTVSNLNILVYHLVIFFLFAKEKVEGLLDPLLPCFHHNLEQNTGFFLVMSTFCWPLYVSCQSQLHLFVIPLYSGHWTRMLTYQLSLLQVLLFHGFWTVFSTEVQGSNSQFSRTAVFEPELVSYKNCPSTMGLFQQCIYK